MVEGSGGAATGGGGRELGGDEAGADGRGKWKAVREPWIGGEIQLFDVEKDIGESADRATENPEVVQQAAAYLEAAHVRSQNWNPPVPKKKKGQPQVQKKKPVTS